MYSDDSRLLRFLSVLLPFLSLSLSIAASLCRPASIRLLQSPEDEYTRNFCHEPRKTKPATRRLSLLRKVDFAREFARSHRPKFKTERHDYSNSHLTFFFFFFFFTSWLSLTTFPTNQGRWISSPFSSSIHVARSTNPFSRSFERVLSRPEAERLERSEKYFRRFSLSLSLFLSSTRSTTFPDVLDDASRRSDNETNTPRAQETFPPPGESVALASPYISDILVYVINLPFRYHMRRSQNVSIYTTPCGIIDVRGNVPLFLPSDGWIFLSPSKFG